ncbi:MAG: hypothetical protein KIT27_11390 [Legionellales bacterium]|nr:hypothetical protein [Legionellales bacterium]
MLIINYPRVFAHRGASAYCIENTLTAMRYAAELGATWVELDVQLTRDNHVVVFHDENLIRLCGLKTTIAGSTLNELQKITFANSDEVIPTLAEMLRVLAEQRLSVNVEIKLPSHDLESLVKNTLTLIQTYEAALPNPVIVSSFSWEALALLREFDAEIAIALLSMRDKKNLLATAKALNACAIHIAANAVTPKLIQACHAEHLKVGVFTVNEKARAQQLFTMGVDGVFSDVVDRLG